MKSRRDPNMPVGKLTPLKDNLPSPEEFSKSIESVRVTMILSKTSVNFFKKSAQKYHTKYQRMMRQVLDSYAARHAA